MDNELKEIVNFISTIPPFEQLPVQLQSTIAKNLSISYLPKGKVLDITEQQTATVYLIRSGVLASKTANDELVTMFSEGATLLPDVFTAQQSDSNNIITCAEEDTLLYHLHYSTLQTLAADFPIVCEFFELSAEQRLSQQVSTLNEQTIIASSMVNSSVAECCKEGIATISHQVSIQQAAQQMSKLGYSSLVITNNERPVGIITDKDIRTRCVAQGLSFEQPVEDIMTDNIVTLTSDASAFDALMLMTSKEIHHLPITKDNKLYAMITITDLMNFESQNAINLTHMIRKAQNVDELIKYCQLLPKLQVKMTYLGTTAENIGKSISAITSALTGRLIEMAISQFGQAPVPWAWLAAGSQARREQYVHSDQDNAIIFADSASDGDRQWFFNLAKFVSDQLAKCGFIYCPGNIMATNEKWCQPQNVWHRYFNQWVNQPKPQALLNSSIFFDLTTIYGDESLLAEVRQKMLAKTRTNTLFLAHLTRNALMLKPPLGFFKDFVLIASGEHKSTLDLKHTGIAPIVDLARIYALSEGIEATNTIERLKQASGSSSLTSASAKNLIDAYQFLGLLRMKHQAQLLQQGKQPNNYLNPKQLSKLEREHLKDAFKVIKTLQDSRQSVY
ncbi:putative nucleotidyltransferase substrate binding domain-containing protein [Thalassotalea ganghwensis]